MATISYRNNYFDFLRGIAILMVIGIHTYCGYSFETFSGNINIIVRQMLNTAVPLFLALSAYFLCKKPLNTWEERTTFYKKQILKVYIPCLFWSLPLFILALMSGGSPLKQTVNLFICGYSIYYFIALIIQYYLLLPWLQPFSKNLMWCAILVSAISILAVSYITVVKGISLPLIVYAAPFPVWIMFFVMGGVMRCNTSNYKLIIPLLVLPVGLVLSYVESKHMYQYHGSGFGFGIKISSYIYSAGVIMLLLNNKIKCLYRTGNFICRIMEYIGRISFGIYLIHCYFIMLLPKFVVIDSWLLKWVLVTSLTISFIAVSRKILPNIMLKYIGFGHDKHSR